MVTGRRGKFSILLCFFAVTFLSRAAAFTDWRTVKTDNFTVFYSPGREDEAKLVLKLLEYYRPYAEKLTGYKASGLPIVLGDEGMVVSGFSEPSRPGMYLFRTPPGSQFGGIESWPAYVGFHEYLHHLSLSNTGGLPGFLRRVLGNHGFLFPNLYMPGWIHEGITVYGESRISPYQGRLNDGLFDAYVSARAAAKKMPSILEATYPPAEDFHLDGIYTYGGVFFAYLAEAYGEEKFADFFTLHGRSLGYFLPFPFLGIDRAAKKVYGKSLPRLWQDWIDRKTKDSANFHLHGERITDRGGRISGFDVKGKRVFYTHSFYVKTGVYSGFAFRRIIEQNLSTGTERILLSTTNRFSHPPRIRENGLYYGVLETRKGFVNPAGGGLGYVVRLRRFDLITETDRVVLEDGIRAFEILEDHSVLYSRDKEKGFGSEIHRYDPKTRRTELLFESNYLVDDLCADGSDLYAVARRDGENFGIFRFDTASAALIPLVSTPYRETGLSAKGGKLYFHAAYDDTVSIYRFDPSNGAVRRLTRTGYAENPVYDPDTGTLFFLGLRSGGFDIYRTGNDGWAFSLPEDPPSPKPDLPDSAIIPGSYFDNIKTLRPRGLLPIVFYDGSLLETGFLLYGGDILRDIPAYRTMVLLRPEEKTLTTSSFLEIGAFTPFTVSLLHTYDRENTYYFIAEYPLVNRRSPGFGNLSLGVLGAWSEFEGKRKLEPFTEIGLRFPLMQASLRIGTPIRRSDPDSAGFGADFALRHYIPGGEVRLKLLYRNDPESPDPVLPLIRGYEVEQPDLKGWAASGELSFPILKIHGGLWNPNFFIEDLVLTLFSDIGVPGTDIEGRRQSWGAEFHCETRIYYFLPLDWGFRVYRTRETAAAEGRFFIRTVLEY
jgi:hypothetical protein